MILIEAVDEDFSCGGLVEYYSEYVPSNKNLQRYRIFSDMVDYFTGCMWELVLIPRNSNGSIFVNLEGGYYSDNADDNLFDLFIDVSAEEEDYKINLPSTYDVMENEDTRMAFLLYIAGLIEDKVNQYYTAEDPSPKMPQVLSKVIHDNS